MTLHERHGQRDLTYSRWHRPDSIGRYLAPDEAAALSCIDIDAVEFCRDCSAPLMLIETARDVGQTFKATTVLAEIARRASIPAAVVFYLGDENGDVRRFRLRGIWPRRTREIALSPEGYAAWLQLLRDGHECRTDRTSCAFRHRPLRRLPGPRSLQLPLQEVSGLPPSLTDTRPRGPRG